MSIAVQRNTGRSPRLPVYRAAKRGRIKPAHRACNLCQHDFVAHTQFDRFCPQCRQSSELFHYYESMPFVEEHRP